MTWWLICFTRLSKYCSYLASCIALCGIHFDNVCSLGVPDKTELDNDQNDKMAADIRIHLNDLYHFKPKFDKWEQGLESRLFVYDQNS